MGGSTGCATARGWGVHTIRMHGGAGKGGTLGKGKKRNQENAVRLAAAWAVLGARRHADARLPCMHARCVRFQTQLSPAMAGLAVGCCRRRCLHSSPRQLHTAGLLCSRPAIEHVSRRGNPLFLFSSTPAADPDELGRRVRAVPSQALKGRWSETVRKRGCSSEGDLSEGCRRPSYDLMHAAGAPSQRGLTLETFVACWMLPHSALACLPPPGSRTFGC